MVNEGQAFVGVLLSIHSVVWTSFPGHSMCVDQHHGSRFLIRDSEHHNGITDHGGSIR